MKFEAKHYALVAAFLAGVGTQLATAQHGWSDVMTTGFVAGLLIQLSTLITAIFVGAPGAAEKLDQANKNTDMANASTRAALADPVDLSNVDPKRFLGPGAAVVLACLLAGGVLLPACANNPPPGTYTQAGQKAFNADQLINDLAAFSQTVINLNAQTGSLHVNDADTVRIRDYTLSAAAGIQAYANGSGTLAIVASSYHTLLGQLSEETKLNDRIAFYLNLIDAALANAK